MLSHLIGIDVVLRRHGEAGVPLDFHLNMSCPHTRLKTTYSLFLPYSSKLIILRLRPISSHGSLICIFLTTFLLEFGHYTPKPTSKPTPTTEAKMATLKDFKSEFDNLRVDILRYLHEHAPPSVVDDDNWGIANL
ncbi:hypothetical protein K469DRAFT_389743 [Zopfia rhizophila CBS 207.26]|uniref:Uncharacterized protein n=1 Tax=Zopfia rhizophila CBS 207.26 TaxID=1314779 RepID=A0A6A6EGJ0_9PEZI|nr:hypothetical protein K469DRAFT_389743 [Zopfia rhizophila CBS 207.26]